MLRRLMLSGVILRWYIGIRIVGCFANALVYGVDSYCIIIVHHIVLRHVMP